jgi:hypothetical protein
MQKSPQPEAFAPKPPKGGYRYSTVADTAADAAGHWVLKGVPAGWFDRCKEIRV